MLNPFSVEFYRGIIIKIIGTLILSMVFISVCAQLPVPENIGTSHPRCMGKNMSQDKINLLSVKQEWAHSIISDTEYSLANYLNYCRNEPDWLLSRLQMYWNTKSDQVYINGGIYHHAEGKAPVATVRFPGTRNHVTKYYTPKTEDIIPYMDDNRGLYLQRRDNKQWEWADMVSSARIVESINKNIIEIARDASFMYWYTSEEAYAEMALGVLDTYLTGLYYLKEPVDLSHGHHQTLVGLTSFEVIQEHHIGKVAQAYDFLYDYIMKNHPEKIDIYCASLQKWADQVIKNGVSFNNWNLFQAEHVSKIALILENNPAYNNGKGAQYYLDKILNQTSIRQWSFNKLINYGYDPETGIWNESPGYALGVLREFINFAEFYDHNFDIDLIAELPVLKKAAKSSVQYLYPNGYEVAFGDGHYSKPDADAILFMIKNAQKYKKEEDEIYFTKLLKTIFDPRVYLREFKGENIEYLFKDNQINLREDIEPGMMEEFTTPLFYAPNVSWLVQRHLVPAEGDLMISQIGSLGNHMHSNGIAMELFGYGLPLSPEMGHGSSYFSIEYVEYYTQFPAHNTVIVNGKSKYPEMKSNHAFLLNAAYPESRKQEGIVNGITFSDVSFTEPETLSDQRRVMGIVADDNEGYYIDIFRSKQQAGKDLKHEYFYHNLGQELLLTNESGNSLNLKPTGKMAFGDGDLMAYDYMWEKKSVKTTENIKGQFNLEMNDRTVSMNVWVQGAEEREIFTALSPKSTAFRHGPIPEELNDLPIPTLVIRQEGEAWKRPFVAVYEPALNETSGIASVHFFGVGEQVGIQVKSKSGKEDIILSNISGSTFDENGVRLEGTYAVVSVNDDNMKMLLGNGQYLSYGDYSLITKKTAAVAFEIKDGQWYISAHSPAEFNVRIQDKKARYLLEDNSGKTYDGIVNKKSGKVCFNLPKMDHTRINMKIKKK